MGIFRRLLRWMDQPAAELVGYRCRDCDTIVTDGDGSCPECGCGELEQAHETVEYAYWGQYH